VSPSKGPPSQITRFYNGLTLAYTQSESFKLNPDNMRFHFKRKPVAIREYPRHLIRKKTTNRPTFVANCQPWRIDHGEFKDSEFDDRQP